MTLNDWEVSTRDGRRSGGQGIVQKVRHRKDGRIGALKLLHGNSLGQTERRYRFLAEVSALKAMAGNGVPVVLDSNEDQWENKSKQLYLIMDHIEGPTLDELLKSGAPTIDQTISTTIRILDILEIGHKLPFHHRDIKPDNVVMRQANWFDPILVDLGIAWNGTANLDFHTPISSELGNRFLRLPEFAPGGDHRDPRSDLAMVAGLLFFMLSGRAPRVLVNHNGQHPHEVEPTPIRADVLADRRWPKLNNLLRIAFQQRIEARFRDANEFRERLLKLNEITSAATDEFDKEVARLRDSEENTISRERADASSAMEQASKTLLAELSRLWRSAGLQWGGQNPVFKKNGASNEFYCVVSKIGQSDPHVTIYHKIEVSNGRFLASWEISGAESEKTFEGSAADKAGLHDTMLQISRNVAGRVVRELNRKLTL
jgi:serine/threonine protein kinase